MTEEKDTPIKYISPHGFLNKSKEHKHCPPDPDSTHNSRLCGSV